MKNFLAAIALCSAVLLICSFVIVRSVGAGAGTPEDIISGLLMMPAPPAPNPKQNYRPLKERTEEFYSKDQPPPDNAPIDDILDYWAKQRYQTIDYNIKPTAVVLDRITAAMESDPAKIGSYLNYLKDSARGIAAVRSAYNQTASGTGTNSNTLEYEGEDYYYDPKDLLKRWLIINDPSFSAELEPLAAEAKDTDAGYIQNYNEFLALAKNDWSRARPLIDKMYADSSQPASQTLARWSLYRKAMDDGSLSDAEKYRAELTATIKNKDLKPGVRDLAFDALVHDKEWSGRDEWYFSLMEDESLLLLDGYTGLTTLIRYSPPGKYTAQMARLVKSSNPTVRAAAARNLAIEAGQGNVEAITALLPWLEDPDWIKDVDNSRGNLVRALGQVKIKGSVPGLIAIMNERVESKDDEAAYDSYSDTAYVSNTVSSMMNRVVNAASNTNGAVYKGPKYSYPFRYSAISALAKQEDPIAAPALRRLYFSTDDEGYYRGVLIGAIYACGGFSLAEQVDALEFSARQNRFVMVTNSPTGNYVDFAPNEDEGEDYVETSNRANVAPISDADQLRVTLARMIESNEDPSDELVALTIQKINSIEPREPIVAKALRQLTLAWSTRAAFAMQLADLKNGKSSTLSVINMLTARKKLRETQPGDVYDARNGVPMAAGIATCILEDTPSYDAILDGTNTEVKAAFFACSRLIRIPLPVQAAAAAMQSTDKRLALAGRLYLESEDSPEARNILFAAFPNQAKITGSRVSFEGSDEKDVITTLPELFATVDGRFSGVGYRNNYFSENDLDKRTERFQKEALTKNDLLGIYIYGKNILRIYADRVTYDVEDDESRSYQRIISQEEFDQLKNYLAQNQVNDMKAFLGCTSGCRPLELVMVGKAGGRRIFAFTDEEPEFFKGLDEIFEGLEKRQGRLRYAAADTLPGFQVLFADPRLVAGTVWADGDDVRFYATDVEARKTIEKEISEEVRRYFSTAEENGNDELDYSYDNTLREKRRYDGTAWYKFSPQGIVPHAVQPVGVEIIPLRTGQNIDVFEDPWRSRGGGVELRSDDDALYKVSGGSEVKIADGDFQQAVVSSDGRWAAAQVYSDETGMKLIRIDLTSRRQYEVVAATRWLTPIAWVSGVNKFLVASPANDYYEYDVVSTFRSPMWLDPVTGNISKVSGTVEPLLQQSFRPLQKASAGGFWAAMPDKKTNETKIGLYDPMTQKFVSKMTVPSIQFSSMEMWVDEKTALIYFVYDGHLLRVPLPK